MGRIYHDCASVVAWLGLEGPETALAFKIMEIVQTQISAETWVQTARIRSWRNLLGEKKEDASPEIRRNIALLDEVMSPAWDAHWEAFSQLMHRSWFYRAWTTQECILPPQGSFWCGNLRCPIRHFFRPVAQLAERLHHGSLDDVFLGSDTLLGEREALRRNLILLEVGRSRFALHHAPMYEIPWKSARRGQCIDPRDHVYSTLGLFDHDPIHPDYAKPVDEVFREFVLVAEPRIDHILYKVEEPSQRVTPNLPSWVPDFQTPGWPIEWVCLGAEPVYNAGQAGDKVILKLESTDPRVFALMGCLVDEVKHVGASFDELVGRDGLLTSLRQLDGMEWAGGDIVETFWRTLPINLIGAGPMHLTAERHGTGFRAMALYMIASSISLPDVSPTDVSTTEQLVESLRRKTNTEFLPTWAEILDFSAALRGDEAGRKDAIRDASARAKEYMFSLHRMFEGRRWYVTDKGSLGTGPMSLRAGDRVCIFQGMRYPCLLRGKGDGGRYTFIGCCYVDGIMHGEALPGAEFVRVEIE
ncbi:hypothetical protein QBC47DRAFT_100622 [Echria macrotheca]|uniref:Heterokaryon incompatibility domain-containing protein n=1 Tax=Echria macrotheca TaxID=438768 RepID=A0AAJ0BLU6_9PEZI|nr:hypothetical protein QBC47DRAFT_100622 [Echria macrotheca]